MKYKQWKVAPPCPRGQRALEEAGLPPLLAGLLSARGITHGEEARRLLSPASEPIPDPLLLRDMDRAAARVRLALERRERIAVYGDYDVDGITSTCLLAQFLTARGGEVLPYIPSRLGEGYGLNAEAVQALAGQGVSLILTVDCGITAVEETRLANRLGIDVVITDHHACKEELPPAEAVVDPHRPDCPYPFKGLAGVGVALMLALAVAGRENARAVFDEFCDLAAIGTVADVMPMMGANRAIVSLGLAKLDRPRRPGLAALIRSSGLEDKPVTSVAVGYTLAPRINASGRMGQAEVAVELFLTDSPARAEELAAQLCELNRERQGIEGEIFQQCVQQLEEEPQEGAIVLAGRQWHQGVVGIVASRLAEKYSCPCFMICLDGGLGKGSCRSWGDVNLFELLSASAPLLENFGGHALAAGFTVREENIPALARSLRRAVLRHCQGRALPSVLEIDLAVTPQQLTPEAVEPLDLLEPCGTGNPRPVFLLQGAQVHSMAQVGRGRHLKLKLESRGMALDAIFFSNQGAELGLYPGCRADVAFYPQINDFRGSHTVQLQVVDLCLAPSRAQLEQAIYDKYRTGEALTREEAQFLLPQRQDFVGLYRWLKRQSTGCTVVEDTPARIARAVSRATRQREIPARTMLCLEVLEERGLINMNRRVDRIQITLCQVEHKVDLEASAIIRRLRAVLEDGV
ncbi:single-stranded-DNA-specific exonuclease RecJ [Pseudoflavonifractor sp. 60]|uniref:single-stranded-DNA-specific exonuclease RecJ n=1 Tax=Pseudoflavonifractor sp. 60 TaxID=2304576 RepID=UPI00136B2124|nr:single-stranded-DNA-specific exonuclease RecJ [Pseudoflavonifractor sp. 60]